jgi:hypothetical protein
MVSYNDLGAFEGILPGFQHNPRFCKKLIDLP